jgi:hypothetical protein
VVRLLRSLAAAGYCPCLVTASRIRSIPCGVFGLVLSPPCSLHRPFDVGIGTALHADSSRLNEEPSRGLLTDCHSSNRPRRGSWGDSIDNCRNLSKP